MISFLAVFSCKASSFSSYRPIATDDIKPSVTSADREKKRECRVTSRPPTEEKYHRQYLKKSLVSLPFLSHSRLIAERHNCAVPHPPRMRDRNTIITTVSLFTFCQLLFSAHRAGSRSTSRHFPPKIRKKANTVTSKK